MSLTKKATAAKTAKQVSPSVAKLIAQASKLPAKKGASKVTKVKVAVTKTPAFTKGAKVTALWDDGKRYPGKVHSVKGAVVTVAWADGTRPSAGEKVRLAK